MQWNWQLTKWPCFTYDSSSISDLEKKFLLESGGGIAILKNLEQTEKKQFIVELLCTEGQKSAEIEGELLERRSLQVSIQRHFGLKAKDRILPKEQGMADLLWNMYRSYKEPLTHEMLLDWHAMIMNGDQRISETGKYRSHDDPMQIVSERYDRQKICFEAPPSRIVYNEMTRFIRWFNESKEQSVLVRAAIAHVYFESIHPFEDGNGRIGRALIEKSLSQGLGHPTLIAISQGLAKRKKDYYKALASCNKTLDIQNWIQFFAKVAMQSQKESFDLIYFLLEKSKLLHRLEGKLNPRQEKVLLRVLAEGIRGFAGGLSAENYIKISKTSRATATRDLNDLITIGALYKTGELKYTRYYLNIKLNAYKTQIQC